MNDIDERKDDSSNPLTLKTDIENFKSISVVDGRYDGGGRAEWQQSAQIAGSLAQSYQTPQAGSS